ncbi:hypothetical protein JHK85_016727 [Glycine max]|nr:hypothetical protein JHK85_016727 [Glycine max]
MEVQSRTIVAICVLRHLEYELPRKQPHLVPFALEGVDRDHVYCNLMAVDNKHDNEIEEGVDPSCCQRINQNLRKLSVPFFVLHGTADSIASQKLYVEASSSDKTSRLYDGFLHDLLFEPERDAITQDMIQ